MSDRPAPRLRRLSRAGSEVTSDTSRVLTIRSSAAPPASFLGEPRWRLELVDIDARTWALVTHLHADHCERQLASLVSGIAAIGVDLMAEPSSACE